MAKRIQFYFPDALVMDMDSEAKKRGISMAEFVRRAVEDYLAGVKKKALRKKDPLDDLAGFFDGDPDLSEYHDAYLYEGHRK